MSSPFGNAPTTGHSKFEIFGPMSRTVLMTPCWGPRGGLEVGDETRERPSLQSLIVPCRLSQENNQIGPNTREDVDGFDTLCSLPEFLDFRHFLVWLPFWWPTKRLDGLFFVFGQSTRSEVSRPRIVCRSTFPAANHLALPTNQGHGRGGGKSPTPFIGCRW